MGSKQKTVTKENSTQTAAPPSWAMPGIQDLAGRVTAAIPQAAAPNYTGNFVAGQNQYDANISSGYANAGNMARGFVPSLQGAATASQQGPQFTGPGIMDGAQSFGSYDPTAVQGVIQAAMQPYMRQLTEQVLPGLQSSGIESGAYGSNRMMETLPSMAIRDTGRMAAEVGSGIAYNDFLSQQQRNQQAYQMATQRGLGEADVMTQRYGMLPELANAAMQMQTAGTDLDVQAAAYQRQLDQLAIDEQMAQYQYDVQRPFQGLAEAVNLMSPLSQPYATQTRNGTTTQTQTQGGLGPIVQGALGLGAMAMGMPGGIGGMSSLFGGAAKGAAAAAPIFTGGGMKFGPFG